MIVKWLGRQDYESVWLKMQSFTDARDASTPDEFWLLEHNAVFTQGRAGKAEHLLNTGDIPVIQADRGGQATYHGPGQLVGYVLFDINRLGLGVRGLVTAIENAIIELLAQYGISAKARADAPGVYLQSNGAKIAQIGLRISKGCSFHGLSLNVDMDLSVFNRINPCGMAGLETTHMAAHVSAANELNLQKIGDELAATLSAQLQQSSAAAAH